MGLTLVRWEQSLAMLAAILIAGLCHATPGGANVQLLGSEDPLSVTATSGSDDSTVYVTAFNAGRTPAHLSVSFVSSSSSNVSVKSFTPDTLAAGAYRRLAVVLVGLGQVTVPLGGQLIVDGGGAPSSRPAMITPAPQPLVNWAGWIMGAVVGVIIVLLLAIGVWAARKGQVHMLGRRAPGPKWSFDSWATTSTALGAVLGVVLGTSLLPDVPRQVSKDSLIGLNLVFAGMVVAAPFLFQAFRSGNTGGSDQDAGLWGYNWALALACAITGGAVLGELATLALTGWEVTNPNVWRYCLLAVLLFLAVLASWYFYVTARVLATTDWAARAAADQTAAVATVQRSSLLGNAGAGEQTPAGEHIAVVVPPITWSLP